METTIGSQNQSNASTGKQTGANQDLNRLDDGMNTASHEAKLEDRWNLCYSKVLAFKKKYGHCRVPTKFPEDTKLGNWVNKQRNLAAGNKLPPHRRQKLDSIGFVWTIYCPRPTTEEDSTMASFAAAEGSSSTDSDTGSNVSEDTNDPVHNTVSENSIDPMRQQQQQRLHQRREERNQLHIRTQHQQKRKRLAVDNDYDRSATTASAAITSAWNPDDDLILKELFDAQGELQRTYSRIDMLKNKLARRLQARSSHQS